MSCKPIKFRNVSPDTFKCMKKKLQDYGIHVPPETKENFQERELRGISNGMENVNLTITITRKAFFRQL